MNEKELIEKSKCAGCGKPFGHTGLPLFWRLKIERIGVRVDALRRHDAMATFLGSRELAGVFSTESTLTDPVMEAVEITLCEECALSDVNIMVLAEKAGESRS